MPFLQSERRACKMFGLICTCEIATFKLNPSSRTCWLEKQNAEMSNEAW